MDIQQATNDSVATRNVSKPRIAVVTMGVKLGDETRGYTRFRFLSEFLCENGFEVDLITSSFQHWDKAPRDTSRACYRGLPYNIVFIDEPGYTRNLDLKRILSHRKAAANLSAYLRNNDRDYRLIYCEIPPNDVARAAAEAARDNGIPFVADINDLWPEAMRMVLDVPVVSDIAFHSFTKDAHRVYNLLSAAVGTSDEYAARPNADRTEPCQSITVYVGNDLASFDAGVAEYAAQFVKPEGQFRVTYTGTLGASYDLATLVRAAAALAPKLPALHVVIAGDGPDAEKLRKLAGQLHAPVEFAGYLPYGKMAALLASSDVAVNSLVADAAQSIVTKIGDYLAAGIPMINTGSSPEFRAKVEHDGFGVNVPAEDVAELAGAISFLASEPGTCAEMGKRARAIAQEQFDQPVSYRAIVDLIRSLI